MAYINNISFLLPATMSHPTRRRSPRQPKPVVCGCLSEDGICSHKLHSPSYCAIQRESETNVSDLNDIGNIDIANIMHEEMSFNLLDEPQSLPMTNTFISDRALEVDHAIYPFWDGPIDDLTMCLDEDIQEFGRQLEAMSMEDLDRLIKMVAAEEPSQELPPLDLDWLN